ncbi:hypothetical protein C2G38_2206695 [Gigaspora rosea]|uniref:Uncharacterized protein n=1 Tax=Gigaspora rosea TaxID=44941 RepID=A0A397UJC6_9GLOM|nr:hypothetical protein C2G38_2206695 [Gigaspora rosea]
MRDFHINEHRVDDIWEDRERQQQIIQSTISTEILPISTAISSENFNQIERKTLYPESTTSLNAEIKKRSSKSRSKSDLDTLYEKEVRRDEKNKANMNRLLAT